MIHKKIPLNQIFVWHVFMLHFGIHRHSSLEQSFLTFFQIGCGNSRCDRKGSRCKIDSCTASSSDDIFALWIKQLILEASLLDKSLSFIDVAKLFLVDQVDFVSRPVVWMERQRLSKVVGHENQKGKCEDSAELLSVVIGHIRKNQKTPLQFCFEAT